LPLSRFTMFRCLMPDAMLVLARRYTLFIYATMLLRVLFSVVAMPFCFFDFRAMMLFSPPLDIFAMPRLNTTQSHDIIYATSLVIDISTSLSPSAIIFFFFIAYAMRCRLRHRRPATPYLFAAEDDMRGAELRY